MKRTYPKILILLILLPVVLAACGGGATGNAEDFINAIADTDADKAKDVACDEFANEIDLLMTGASGNPTAEDVKCEDDGDDVKCTFKDEDDSENEITFTMTDDKVCGIKAWSRNGEDTGAVLPSNAADGLPSE
jgi:hypothetical protein